MEAKTMITLQGVGAALSGNYYVTEVSHDLGQHGYEMTVKCRRDGTNKALNGAAVASKAAQNKGKASAGDDTEMVAILVPDAQTGAPTVRWVKKGTVLP